MTVTFSDGIPIRTASDQASRAQVPVAIHLEHNMIPLAADKLPFDSSVVDISLFEKENNLAKIFVLVKYCHELVTAMVAEPGDLR